MQRRYIAANNVFRRRIRNLHLASPLSLRDVWIVESRSSSKRSDLTLEKKEGRGKGKERSFFHVLRINSPPLVIIVIIVWHCTFFSSPLSLLPGDGYRTKEMESVMKTHGREISRPPTRKPIFFTGIGRAAGQWVVIDARKIPPLWFTLPSPRARSLRPRPCNNIRPTRIFFAFRNFPPLSSFVPKRPNVVLREAERQGRP